MTGLILFLLFISCGQREIIKADLSFNKQKSGWEIRGRANCDEFTVNRPYESKNDVKITGNRPSDEKTCDDLVVNCIFFNKNMKERVCKIKSPCKSFDQGSSSCEFSCFCPMPKEQEPYYSTFLEK